MPVPARYLRFARLLALRDRLAALCRRPRRPEPARLGFESLEDRSLLTAVGPGGSWDDGHYDQYGNKVGVTVTLYNSGD